MIRGTVVADFLLLSTMAGAQSFLKGKWAAIFQEQSVKLKQGAYTALVPARGVVLFRIAAHKEPATKDASGHQSEGMNQ